MWALLNIHKQVGVVLLLETRRHAVLSRLITHAYILNTVYYNNVLKFVLQCFCKQIKLILYLIIRELLGFPEIRC